MMVMARQGGQSSDEQTLNVLKIIGLVTPVLLLGYGLLIQNNQINSSNYVSNSVFYALMSLWLAYGLYQYFFPAITRQRLLINLIFYHMFAAVYITFISGFTVPFLSAWALLYLASYVYFSFAGFLVSSLWFLVVMFADMLVQPVHQETVLFNLVAAIATVLVGVAAVLLNRVKDIDIKAVEDSKQAELLQRDRIFTLINNLADAIISTDPKGVITVYNAAFLNLLDTNESIEGKDIDEVLKLHLLGKPKHLVPLLHKSKSVTVNDEMTSQIGDEAIRLEVTYSPIRSSYNKAEVQYDDGYVVIFRDITKAKSLEEERDEFISVVSHELRTPIAVTEGAIDNARLIFEKSPDQTDTVKSTLSLAHEQVVFLGKMINDLSTLSRAERGVADSAEVINVTELAHSLHSEYAPEAEKKGLQLNLSAHGKLGQVKASRLYLQELLQNFITNSIKYTKQGNIDIIITSKNDRVKFLVKDTGIGISKADQVKIFEKFYRSEDYRTRETGGTGLGLYVAQKLSKKLGCSIEVKSRLNHGSSFSFSLPSYIEVSA